MQPRQISPGEWGLTERLTKTDRATKRSTIRERSGSPLYIGNRPEARSVVRDRAHPPVLAALRAAPGSAKRSIGPAVRYRDAIISPDESALFKRAGVEKARTRAELVETSACADTSGRPEVGAPSSRASRLFVQDYILGPRALCNPLLIPRAPFSILIIAPIARPRCETARLG